MTIDRQIDGDKVVLAIDGRLDTQTAPQLEREIMESTGTCRTLILDFQNVPYTSSAGLRVLLKAQKTMNAKDGTLEIRHVNENVREVLEMTGFLDFLTLVD